LPPLIESIAASGLRKSPDRLKKSRGAYALEQEE
jgi:hypothetical protein